MDYSFGNWVKRTRKSLDLTQQELAKRVGCSASLIFKIESDERRPSRQIAELLAQHLEIPAGQRPLFFKVARQEKGIQNLDWLPSQGIPGLSLGSISDPAQERTAPVYEQLKNNLPFPPTPLVGREHEISMVLQQLRNPACRLLTLTGPGGVGKTRLALEVASKSCDVFEHGVTFVSLAGTPSAEYILPAIADSMNFTFTGGKDPKAQLFQFIQGKYLLLVLDNLEHLLDGAGLIAELLESSHQIKILATSREQLNLRAEWAFAVQGLPIPLNISLENMGANSAVALFLQRSRQAKLDFTLTAEDLLYVEQICRLVEGSPLGLELAAAWVRTLSCREIAREIETNLDFLTATARDVPQRHRSMRAVFEYSWRLLNAEEQQVLSKLSVFRGGFSRDSASQVASATLPLLSKLVDKSLVRHSMDGRYELHELVRQFADEQLACSGKLEETRNRHFAFHLALAEESRSRLRRGEQLVWMNRLEQDYDNLRAALEWSLRYEKLPGPVSEEEESIIQASFRYAGALYMFWRMRDQWSEGRKWLKRVLDQPARQPVTRERSRALNAAALLAAEQADLREARQLADQNLALAHELGDAHILARAFHARGVVLWKQKDYAAAHDSCEQAVVRFREMGNRLAMAGSLQILGRIAINQHNLEMAHTYLTECVQLFREFSNTIELYASLSDLGLLAYLRNDFSTARSCHESSLVYFREARNIAGIEMTMNRLGDIARCENNYEEAEKLYTESLNVYRDTGDKDEIASLLHNLGYVAQHRGEPEKALALFKEALSLQRELDNQAGIAECLAGIAGIWAAQGQTERAGRLFGASEALREAAGVVLWPANQIEYDRNLALLRNSFAEDRLAAAWAQGFILPSEQAMDEALNLL